MLYQHDPPVSRCNEIKNFIDLRTGIAQTVFHNFSCNMSLLIWKENYSGALNVGTLEGFYPPAEPVVEY